MSTATFGNATSVKKDLSHDFPALQLARTGRLVRLFGRLTFVLLSVSIAAMFFVPWRQTARGTGIVTALNPQERPQAVQSPAKGVISYVKPGLREGSEVTAGDLVLRLTPFAVEGVQLIDSQITVVTAKRAAAEMNVTVAEQAVSIQEQSGKDLMRSFQDMILAAEEKWEQTQNEVAAAKADLDDKLNKKKTNEESFPVGVVSRLELVSSQQAAIVAEAKLEKARNAVEEAKNNLDSKRKEIASKQGEVDIKNRSAVQKLNAEKQKLEATRKELIELQTKRAELDRLEIRAPRSGVIQQWYAEAGSDTVKEGDQLFVIVPQTTELAVEMKVTGNDMPLIKEGDTVRLQFEGWPAVQFVGWPSVAVGTFGGQVNRVFPTDDGKGNFRVLVSPGADNEDEWPDDRYLRQGVRANGWVLLKEVPLGYEIWRQLNGFPPTVEEEPDKDDKKGGKVKLPKP